MLSQDESEEYGEGYSGLDDDRPSVDMGNYGRVQAQADAFAETNAFKKSKSLSYFTYHNATYYSSYAGELPAPSEVHIALCAKWSSIDLQILRYFRAESKH